MANQAHHRKPKYVQGSAIVRRRANHDPLTVCWRCGRTRNQHDWDAGPWQAGHTIDGSETWAIWTNTHTMPPPGDWLAPEIRRCNIIAGNLARQDRHTETW
jgi:hypothetical protein